jgi:hypothetical protein
MQIVRELRQTRKVLYPAATVVVGGFLLWFVDEDTISLHAGKLLDRTVSRSKLMYYYIPRYIPSPE